MKKVLSMAIMCFMAAPAAAITVDGTKDAGYGAALAIQTTQTQFGDNLSEMDAGYAVLDSGKLYLMLTGNIENNFSLILFRGGTIYLGANLTIFGHHVKADTR